MLVNCFKEMKDVKKGSCQKNSRSSTARAHRAHPRAAHRAGAAARVPPGPGPPPAHPVRAVPVPGRAGPDRSDPIRSEPNRTGPGRAGPGRAALTSRAHVQRAPPPRKRSRSRPAPRGRCRSRYRGNARDAAMAAGGPRGGDGAEHEAEQPQFSNVPQSKQDPESKQGSEPLEAAMVQPLPIEQNFSASADQYVLPILGETPSGEPPDPKKCSPREYLEFYIFPVLLPGLAALLHEAEKEKCFEGKRTKFIPSDFLTEWLYNKNPKRKDESFTELFSIPFVKDWLKDRPRPPIPLSLLLSEEEASILIQSFWRGYRRRLWPCHGPKYRTYTAEVVRCDSEIQELRQWQKKLREERHITEVVKKFWTKQEAKVGSKSEEMD
ncbi:IQ domain-containing protein K [Oenanthe melanoleuca]|uniref:IQ domain-containing protein K n=1 Tax=Oenanthe melanoleuca TaxID=2939378 RepID=UPI0024C10422|nr:IQ domain-containing protein K [Oenanthe melanoleuca]